MKLLFQILVWLCVVGYSSNLIIAQPIENGLEKIHLHTDRPLYFPGETIWFKAYVVNASHTITNKSEVMYVEIIGPDGSTTKMLKLQIKQGYAYGDIRIKEDWLGGTYQLKAFTNWMRNFGDESYFVKDIIVQKVVKPSLLMELDFEKEGYGKSGNVIANFKVENLKNIPLNTNISFSVSISGKIYKTETTTTDLEGKAAINFNLPENLNSSDVILNVKVPYKGSFESISRSVPVVLGNVDLQFFPESGKILNNTQNRVAFKAVDEFGKPVDISGRIFNSEDEEISPFSSLHDGMGSFEITPKSDKRYYVRIDSPFKSDARHYLAKAINHGVNFRLETDSVSTVLKLHSTYDKPLRLEVFNGHEYLLKESINPKSKSIVLNTKKYPIGITNFRITDEFQNPLAERIAFINVHKQLKVELEIDQEVYQARSKVRLVIKTSDIHGKAIPANLSVAVADNKLLSYADDKQDHILSNLLLSSELKGKIHEPQFYFDPDEEKSLAALDLVMLTHGWRDYIYSELNENIGSFKPEFFGLRTGRVVDENNNPVKAKLLLFDNENNTVLDFETNDDGTYFFKKTEDKALTLVAYNEDGEKLYIKENYDFPTYNIDNSNSILNIKGPEANKFDEFRDHSKENTAKNFVKGNASISLGANFEELDEVVIVSYGEFERLNSSVRIIRNERNTDFTQSLSNLLQGRITGVQVRNTSTNSPDNTSPLIRSSASVSNQRPLVVIDGMPYDYDMLKNLDLENFDNITVLKNSLATQLYGAAGSHGVIVMNTKSGMGNYNKKTLSKPKFNNFAIKVYNNSPFKGFYRSRLFYTPKYESDSNPDERKDFRQTIYWNPVVQTDKHGKAELNFYTSDAITSFKITAEGIGYNGQVGRHEKSLASKKLLNLDVKLPNYMVLNDTINIPLTITNESDHDIESQLLLELPESLKLIDSLYTQVKMKAKSSEYRTVKVVPQTVVKDTTLKIGISSGDMFDKIQKPFSIISPYFPKVVSISGMQSNAYEFNLENAVEGQISSEFNIYTDIIGDVMDGIEGIIRQPYGCFEQVSSSTYPNILILKYLRTNNKSNKAIEDKAMKFIIDGYDKLVAYETSKDGFEWYGKSPPHEALTAYGLMQFKEMRELYPGVDQDLIRRTIRFLLSRKDGRGGFKQNRGKYGFSGVRTAVNNAYIVYAMSEAGVQEEIFEEYETAYDEAIKSEDSYRMALIALASHNFDHSIKFGTLISKLKSQINELGFEDLRVENTITNSYDRSKQIEAASFTLLALMKENNRDNYIISKGIEFIVSNRKNGRFGSTQSTAMAIKALIEYSKGQQRKLLSNPDFVSVKLNHEQIDIGFETEKTKGGKLMIKNIQELLKNGKNIFEVEYSDDAETYPFALNINYDSFLPESNSDRFFNFNTFIEDKIYQTGDNISLKIDVENLKNEDLGMVTAVIGIPSGANLQTWQLKSLIEEQKVAYYEIFDNYLVFYWRNFKAHETKALRLDLKADIPGLYQAPASAVYPYYGDEHKTWIQGNKIKIE
jgi:hypothetical protein